MPKSHQEVPYEIAVGQYLPGHDWRCEKLLGRGGMGSVYQMVRGELRFEAAIKLMHRNLATQSNFVQLFLEEARILKQVGDHPNLPRILDFAKLPDGTPFIVMELLEGNSLGRILRSEPGKQFDRDVAFRIIDQVLAGVFELHSQGIIHRDLKPDNIFLERRAKAGPGAAVKILDCGLAFKDSSQHEGALQGTPKYMSPEQVRCEPVSPQTDLYAVALIFCEMLLGRLPFDVRRDGVKAWLDAHQWTEPSPLNKYFDWISARANDLVLSALSKTPEKRPRSALDFQNGLYLEAKRLRDGRPPEADSSDGDANTTTPTPMDFSDATSPDGLNRTDPVSVEAARLARKETLRMELAPTHPAAGNVWQPPPPSAEPMLTGVQPSVAMASPVAVAASQYRAPDPPPAPSQFVPSGVAVAVPQPVQHPALSIHAGSASIAVQPSYADSRVSAVQTSTAGTVQSSPQVRADHPSVEMRRSIQRRVIFRSAVLLSGLAFCSVVAVALARVVSSPTARAAGPTASIAETPAAPPPLLTASVPATTSPASSASPPASTTGPAAAAVAPSAAASTATVGSASTARATPVAAAVPVATSAPARVQPVVRKPPVAAAPRPQPTADDGFKELFR